jgi:hypothetical protein
MVPGVTMAARLIACLMLLCLSLVPAQAQEEVTFEQMRDAAQTSFATLTALLPVNSPQTPPPCDLTAPGQTYALFFGADSFGPGASAKLTGTANSVALLTETLIARGIGPANLITLTGANATRAGLTHAFDALLQRVGCNDHVVVFVSAVSANTISIAGWMSGGASDSDWITASADSDPLMRAIVESAPFLLGNPSQSPAEELISAAALSEGVTLLRNRSAHVTLILDTTYAAGFGISARQMAVDGRLLWREHLSKDSTAPAGPAPTLLGLRAGALSVMYSADQSSMSAEMRLPDDSPDAAVYGLFVFKLAAALRADDALTLPSLARQLTGLELAPEYRQFQNHVMETTDAGLPILAELAANTPAAPPEHQGDGPEVIYISAPEPSRAAVPLADPVLTIKGRVEWPEETLIVLVGQEQALSRRDGQFQHEVTLKEGLNRIEIVALTRDNRQHNRVLEVSYSGDPGSLVGGGQRYALLIANQTYGADTGMPALQTPFADAEALAEVLTRRYGFMTEATLPDGAILPLILKDATRAQIETTLFQLSRIVGEADQLLVYYAGHGVFEQMTGTAFWVPADAVAGVPPIYISASGISEALLRLQAGSVIVISDSCYSGALLRGGTAAFSKPTEADRARVLARLGDKRSRVLITSGANEPVADGGGDGHSIFARAFLFGLTKAPGPLAAQEMFDDYVYPIVIGRADQEPQYRPIAKSGHEGGDFIFAPIAP